MTAGHHLRDRKSIITLSDRTTRVLHWVGVGLAASTVLVLVQSTRFNLLDERPGGNAFDITVKPVFTLAFAVGAVVAWRWKIVGGVITAFAAGGLSAFAIGQLEPVSAGIVMLGFAVPGTLWLLVDLNDQHPNVAVAALAGVALAVTTGAVVSASIYANLYGPSHPASTTAPLPSSKLEWVWSGGVTTTAAIVVAKLGDDAAEAQLLVGTRADLADARPYATAQPDDHGVLRFEATGLKPGMQYHYAVAVEGGADRLRSGTFRTPRAGPQSFIVAVGSCSRVGSNGAVFDAIRELDPDLFIINGDWNYANLTDNDQSEFREIYDYTLTAPSQAALYRTTPIAYVWDDHDYGGNNADATSATREAALDVYREYVPHYPLASNSSPIYQAFTIGRVRFLMTDTRAARSPRDTVDDAGKTMLGEEQKAWLKRELLAADDDFALTVWINPTPWIEAATVGGDTWGGYSTERNELADFIADNGLERIVMLSGDAHMVAIDDGTNTDFSTNGVDASFPLLHAAALDRPGSVKGGPFSEGAIGGGGQFGTLEVEDTGAAVRVRLTARNWSNEVLLAHQFEVADDET
jgi:phosphodiesterase/alkaline phosphatase D-like protein